MIVEFVKEYRVTLNVNFFLGLAIEDIKLSFMIGSNPDKFMGMRFHLSFFKLLIGDILMSCDNGITFKKED